MSLLDVGCNPKLHSNQHIFLLLFEVQFCAILQSKAAGSWRHHVGDLSFEVITLPPATDGHSQKSEENI